MSDSVFFSALMQYVCLNGKKALRKSLERNQHQ